MIRGLTVTGQKFLPDKYLYDDEGSRIFGEIMKAPEYYLARSELEIFKTHGEAIARTVNSDKSGVLNIIELGAGNGAKTIHLLEHLCQRKEKISYHPVDISSEALDQIGQRIKRTNLKVEYKPLCGDYFNLTGRLPSRNPSLWLFLGNNIGNLESDQSRELLSKFEGYMRKGDHILIGFDLVKNPLLIMSAYMGKGGVIRQMHMNLLTRLNRELGGNFDHSKFEYYAFYEPIERTTRFCLVSLESQRVYFEIPGKEIHLDKYEVIRIGISRKFSIESIEELGRSFGFTINGHYTDQRDYFCDSLWSKG